MPSTNPIFNDNVLKLGTFCTNGSGAAMTRAPEAPELSWETSVRAAQLADRAGLEAIVPYARWKGYDTTRPSSPSGVVLDPVTWAAGIAQATAYAGVFATSHAPTVHPVMAAKQSATADLISGGRFGLNVVGGWNRPELEMFGSPLAEHEARYDQLEEWLAVVRKLWTETDEFDHHGRFYDLVGGISLPHPAQRPHPPIMNAGGSDRGLRFACAHADMCFVLVGQDAPDSIRASVERYRQVAREEFGREIQVWTNASVVQRDSVREAEAYLNRYAVEYEDTGAVDGWLDMVGQNSRVLPPDVLKSVRLRFAAGSGGLLLVGTPDVITDRLEMLSSCGIDGVLLSWLDYVDGVEQFTADVLPLLEKRELRTPFVPTREAS